jgi:hypothetical protein
MRTTSGANTAVTGNNAQTNNITVTGVTTGIAITDHAGGGSHAIMPPAMVLPFILRVI